MTLTDMMNAKYTITFENGLLHYMNDDAQHEGMMTLTKQDIENLKYNAGQLFLSTTEECRHESDNIEHVMIDEGGSFSMKRCNKCGEFYR